MSINETEMSRREAIELFLTAAGALPLTYTFLVGLSARAFEAPETASLQMSETINRYLHLAPAIEIDPNVIDHVLGNDDGERYREGKTHLGGELHDYDLVWALDEASLPERVAALKNEPVPLLLNYGSSAEKLAEHQEVLIKLVKAGNVLVATDAFGSDSMPYQALESFVFWGLMTYNFAYVLHLLSRLASVICKDEPAEVKPAELKFKRRDLLKQAGLVSGLALLSGAVGTGVMVGAIRHGQNLRPDPDQQAITSEPGIAFQQTRDLLNSALWQLLGEKAGSLFVQHGVWVRDRVMVLNSLLWLNLLNATDFPRPQNFVVFGGSGHSNMVHLLEKPRALGYLEKDLRQSAANFVRTMSELISESEGEKQTQRLNEWQTLSRVYSYPLSTLLPAELEHYPTVRSCLPLKSPRLLLYEELLKAMASEEQPSRKQSQRLMLEQLAARDLVLLYQDNALVQAKAAKSGLPTPVGFDRLGLPRPAKNECLAKDFIDFQKRLPLKIMSLSRG